MVEFNVPAALVAGVAGFFLGGLWYSKKGFGTAWGKSMGYFDASGQVKPEIAAKHKHPARAFLVAIPCSVVSALLLAWWLGPSPDLAFAVSRATMAGAGFVGMSLAINYQFCVDGNGTVLAIDAGYHTAQFAVFGLVLGLWH